MGRSSIHWVAQPSGCTVDERFHKSWRIRSLKSCGTTRSRWIAATGQSTRHHGSRQGSENSDSDRYSGTK